ncbi:hypothetical protein BJX61DRAFT_543564 [Aspergillus egyptiacus]|nr:hypothetical protein BJX61DRAFT_543564 [Aspergillus egyptiacus]
MDSSIDLGQTVFSSSVSGLTLSLRACASVQIASQGPFSRFNSEHLKESLLAGNIWMDQAPATKLNILITSDPALHTPFSDLVSRLGDAICKAKMWSELGLCVSYRSCIQRASSPIIELSFGIQKRIEPSENPERERLPAILKKPLGDIRPPIDIPTARLLSVNLIVYYTLSRRCIQPYAPCPVNSGIFLEEPHNDDDDIIPDYEDLHYERLSCPSSSTLANQENSSSVPNTGSEGFLNPQILGTLFQNAFRTLVWGDASQPNENQPGAESYHSLSEIAPAIFKPRYERLHPSASYYTSAMNQRSRLIPSIAKSLASMIELSDDQDPKEKFSVLEAPHTFSSGAQSGATQTEDTKRILKTKLWRIAQRGLLKAPTPKQLCTPRRFFDLQHESEHDRRSQDEPLLSETASEATVYFEDACDEYDYSRHPSHDEEHFYLDNHDEFLLELDLNDMRDEISEMMLEDSIHGDITAPGQRNGISRRPSYTSMIQCSEGHASDDELLSVSEEVYSSQTTFADFTRSFAERFSSECDEQMLCG